MAKTSEAARERGLRAALAATGGRVRAAAVTTIVINSAALVALITAAGCVPKFWGPPAPPAFRRTKR